MNPTEQPRRILLVEDDADVRRMMQTALSEAGHRVIATDGVSAGFQLFQAQTPELVVLDVNLPDGNGLELCRRIRAHKTLFATPVIILTARGLIDEKLAGFEAGADQYLAKPVHPKELLSWVQALLQRLSLDKGEGDRVAVGDVVIEVSAHLVRFGNQVIGNLTVKEFDLFRCLVRKSPQVLSRQYILSKLWRTVAVDHVVDMHIGNLRRKLPPALADRVQSVPGKGFRYFY